MARADTPTMRSRFRTARLPTLRSVNMVTHMKTTIDIADNVLASAKAVASREGVTLRSLIEEGLRLALNRRRATATRFRLRNASFKGRGLQEGVQPGEWNAIVRATYEGRGG